jgi:hypothetical protein
MAALLPGVAAHHANARSVPALRPTDKLLITTYVLCCLSTEAAASFPSAAAAAAAVPQHAC